MEKSNTVNSISLEHWNEHLRTSGIKKEIALKNGWFSAEAMQARKLIGHGESGLVIPYINTKGEIIDYRIRQDNPITENGRPQKYLTSHNSNAFIYFSLEQIEHIKKSKKLLIVEGEKKQLKFLQEQGDYSIPVIAIGGCWMYRKRDQAENEVHPILEELLVNKTEVIIIPDTDYFSNFKVKSAYNRLAKTLFKRGIRVSLVDLRIKGDVEKVGVDDFLLKKNFCDLMARIEKPYNTI